MPLTLKEVMALPHTQRYVDEFSLPFDVPNKRGLKECFYRTVAYMRPGTEELAPVIDFSCKHLTADVTTVEGGERAATLLSFADYGKYLQFGKSKHDTGYFSGKARTERRIVQTEGLLLKEQELIDMVMLYGRENYEMHTRMPRFKQSLDAATANWRHWREVLLFDLTRVLVHTVQDV
jgi:hypothetical protein